MSAEITSLINASGGVAAVLRKHLRRAYQSGCMCGAGWPEDWIYKLPGSNNFCHDDDCHKVIIGRLLGYKIKERK